MKEKICNDCEFLNIDEAEQNIIKKREGWCPPHICTKYNKRVLHFPYREPYIHPCEECAKNERSKNQDTCISCGEVIPEGRQVCSTCEKGATDERE